MPNPGEPNITCALQNTDRNSNAQFRIIVARSREFVELNRHIDIVQQNTQAGHKQINQHQVFGFLEHLCESVGQLGFHISSILFKAVLLTSLSILFQTQNKVLRIWNFLANYKGDRRSENVACVEQKIPHREGSSYEETRHQNAHSNFEQ